MLLHIVCVCVCVHLSDTFVKVVNNLISALQAFQTHPFICSFEV